MSTAISEAEISAEQLETWDRTHLWHAFTQMQDYHPLVFESAEGIWLKDIHGHKYLDGVSSLWCNVHGHRHPALDNAMREQIDRVAHVTLLGSSNDTAVKLAHRLASVAPGDLDHVFFSSDGASAIEAALKMAFQYWRQKADPDFNRSRFMALSLAYHGDTIGSVSLGGVDKFHALFKPLLFDVVRLPGLNRNSGSHESQLSDFLQAAKPIFAAHHHEVAALIVEPLMQGAAGMIKHPPGMLAALRQLCDQYDILMIADEVAVGFGKTGSLFACTQESVVPDILCLGKGLTGGYLPLSATLARQKIWTAFLGDENESKTLFHGHTFGGNPIAAAVALANIDLMMADGFFESIKPTIEKIQHRLTRLREHESVEEVRQAGVMVGIQLSDNCEYTAQHVCYRIREKRVLLRPLGNVVVIMPPLVTQPAEIDFIFDAVEYGLNKAKN